MPTIDLSVDKPVIGTASDANLIRNAFDTIQAAVNALDNNNIAANAGINVSKLGQSGATANQGLVWTGSAWAPTTIAVAGYLAAPQKYGTLIDVVSSVAETDILQAAGYSIPGNTLGTTGAARVTIIGDYLNNTGGAVTGDFRVYFGGTLLYQNTAASFASFAGRRAFQVNLLLANLGVTNSQHLVGQVFIGDQNAAGTGISLALGGTGPGANMAGWNLGPFAITNTAAIDTTAAKTLRVTWQHGTSSANAELRVRYSLIEFI